MISAQNRLLPLSGSRWLLFIGIAILATACSPKTRPVTTPVSHEPATVKTAPEKAPDVKSTPRPAAISMLLPFDLDNLSPGLQYTGTTLQRAILSLDYYQGFKLALDSLTGQGYNYKLQVFDTKEQPAQAHSLAYNQFVRSSDLIIGPVFPDDMLAFTSALTGINRPVVSPLSPASPSTIKNQSLITVATPLEYHALFTAKYIIQKINPKKIFILKSGYSDENNYILPFKKTIDSLSKGKTRIIAATIVRGRLNGLIPQLSTTGENIFLVPSTNQAFLMVTLRALDTLAKKYKVTLFGHPSWGKFTYLNTEVLQRLNTHITSSDKADYKSAAVMAFARVYRKTYHAEPSEYALIGFDEGFYFGGLLGANKDGLKKLSDNDFTGLLNNFHFIKKPGIGWINTHVNVWQYNNFELKKTE